jgi:hypothetical protein
LQLRDGLVTNAAARRCTPGPVLRSWQWRGSFIVVEGVLRPSTWWFVATVPGQDTPGAGYAQPRPRRSKILRCWSSRSRLGRGVAPYRAGRGVSMARIARAYGNGPFGAPTGESGGPAQLHQDPFQLPDPPLHFPPGCSSSLHAGCSIAEQAGAPPLLSATLVRRGWRTLRRNPAPLRFILDSCLRSARTAQGCRGGATNRHAFQLHIYQWIREFRASVFRATGRCGGESRTPVPARGRQRPRRA